MVLLRSASREEVAVIIITTKMIIITIIILAGALQRRGLHLIKWCAARAGLIESVQQAGRSNGRNARNVIIEERIF